MIQPICTMAVTSRNGRSVFTTIRYECEKKVKFTVSYNSPVNGNPITVNVCATHKNSLATWANRVKTNTGYDVNIVITPIDKL